MSVLFPGVIQPQQVRLFSAGYLELDDWWGRTDRLRSFWRLYVDDSEGAVLRLGRRRFEIPAQRPVLVPPGLDFEIELEAPLNQLFIHFEFVGWPTETVGRMVPEPFCVAHHPDRERLVEELRSELSSAKEIDGVLGSRLVAFVQLCAAELLSSLPRGGRPFLDLEAGRPLLAVLHFIHDHLDQPLSNAQLAELASCSESRFIRRFRDTTGQTPARYVQDARLRRAAELLLATDAGIDAIADQTGFANRHYFTRVFTRRIGIPPATYRGNRPHLPAG